MTIYSPLVIRAEERAAAALKQIASKWNTKTVSKMKAAVRFSALARSTNSKGGFASMMSSKVVPSEKKPLSEEFENEPLSEESESETEKNTAKDATIVTAEATVVSASDMSADQSDLVVAQASEEPKADITEEKTSSSSAKSEQNTAATVETTVESALRPSDVVTAQTPVISENENTKAELNADVSRKTKSRSTTAAAASDKANANALIAALMKKGRR